MKSSIQISLIPLQVKYNMKKLKVLTVVGTRPEIIRLSRVIPALDRSCEHIIVHTGQNYDYELNQIFFDDLEIREPNYYLNAAVSGSIGTIGKILIEIEKVLDKEKPDAVLVLGDTNSCISLIAAKRKKIPTFHMEAGNRCFDMRVPEEINRKIVDHTADINLTYSSIAREYLLREGLPPEMVIKTGSPMKEVLTFYQDKIYSSKILEKLDLHENNYFLLSAHREENIESEINFKKLINSMNMISEEFKIPIIVSTHPRTRKMVDSLSIKLNKEIIFLKPLSFTDYNKLQLMARATLSDSGTITEESSIQNFPALNIREAHERPEGMEEAAVMMVGLDSETIIQGLSIINNQPRGKERLINEVEDYDVTNVSEKVVRIIHSYTNYVNRVVWKKY